MQRFKTVVERDWGRFGESGFKEIEEGKLEFDLSEGERVDIRAKHETLDWVSLQTIILVRMHLLIFILCPTGNIRIIGIWW